MATVELLTERMVAGGDAIAREPSGRVVFVTGALPGERVRARLTEEKADFARAVWWRCWPRPKPGGPRRART